MNRDLRPLQRLLELPGPDWDYIVTGVTQGPSGNEERMAFLFDQRRVRFTNLAGQVVLPKAFLVRPAGGSSDGAGLQFARAPYVARFQAGWFKFNLCTVHIYFGADSGEALERRIDEITWQISDHLLLWVELKVDFTNAYLGSLKPDAEPLADPPG